MSSNNKILELIVKSEKIFEEVLNNLSFNDYNLIIDDLNNLTKEEKNKNNILIKQIKKIKKENDFQMFILKSENYF